MNFKIYHHPLNNSLTEHLAKLFVETFNAPPRNETWTLQTAQEFIEENLKKDGQLIVAYSKNGSIFGYIMGLPLKSSPLLTQFQQMVSPKRNLKEWGYYTSTMVVTKSHQGQGIGKALIKFHLAHLNNPPYKFICTRTRQDAVVINHILKQFDFKIIGTYAAEMWGNRADRYLHIKTIKQ